MQLLRRDVLRGAQASRGARVHGGPHPEDSGEPHHDAVVGRLVFSGHLGRSRASPYLFSQKEVRDIIIAWAALALAFTIASRGGLARETVPLSGPYFYVIAFVAVGSGFVLHELMHKFTAERYGYWAEFRMWVMGIVLALITSTLGVHLRGAWRDLHPRVQRLGKAERHHLAGRTGHERRDSVHILTCRNCRNRYIR